MSFQKIMKQIAEKTEAYGVPIYYFQPLKIEFLMGSPIMLSYPWIQFDGMIAHLQAQEILGSLYDELPFRNALPFVRHLPLPFQSEKLLIENKVREIYHASISLFEQALAVSTTTIYKKFSEEKTPQFLQTKKKKIDLTRGKYKLYAMKMPLNYSDRVIFFANGDLNMLRKLCDRVQFLGKKRAIGYGEVVSVEVSPVQEDWSLKYRDATIKPLPVEYYEQRNLPYSEDNLAMLAYHPPYWDKQDCELCVGPDLDYDFKEVFA